MSGLTWIHISDWHQKDTRFDPKVVRDRLVKDIEGRTAISPFLEKIDFIVFSGDLAFKGQAEEYIAAKKEFLDHLLKASEVNPRQLFIIPGNHDMDETVIEQLPDEFKRDSIAKEEVDLWLEDGQKREQLLKPFEKFKRFVADYTGQDSPDYSSVRTLIIDGKKIALLCLNSAWWCRRHKNDAGKFDDFGFVLVGEPQIHERLDQITDANLKIAVLHHSQEWLVPFDGKQVWNRLKRECDFILHGHGHTPKVTVEHSTDGDCIIIPAGASFDRRVASESRFTNSYNFVHLDLETGKGTVFLRRWIDSRIEWAKDHETYPEGSFPISLPRTPADSPGPSTLPAVSCHIPPLLKDFMGHDEGPQILLDQASNNAIQIARVKNVFCSVPSPMPPSSRHQLPRDIMDFSGRMGQLEKAKTIMDPEIRGVGTAPAILAVYGMPGVGKSAFAIHLAHFVTKQFPYAQLYIDLSDGNGRNKDPQTVLAGFLRVLGVEVQPTSINLEDYSSLYRSQLSDKQALILLDNAHDVSQVRPLLPGGPMCTVVVTSRKPLSTLEGASLCNLGILSEDESLEFLGRLISNDRVQSELEAAKRAVNLCGRLPLAIRIAGGTLREKPHWSIEYYVSRLADEKKRLEQLKLDDLDVRASFLISYRELSSIEARLFRLLNVLDVCDFSSETASAILNAENDDAIEAIEALVKVQLLEPLGEGRYRFHDLVRLFAKELLEKNEKPRVRNAARLRAINWYAKRSTSMFSLFYPRNRGLMSEFFLIDADKLDKAEKASFQNALNWFECERTNLISLIDSANTLAECRSIWHLAHSLSPFLEIRAYWRDIVLVNMKALQAVNRIGDRSGKSIILNNLGNGYRLIGKCEEALSCLTQSLEIEVESGNRQDESTVLMNIGNVFSRQHKFSEAMLKYKESLAIKEEIGDLFGKCQVLIGLAFLNAEIGNLDEAIDLYKQGITISKMLGNLVNEELAVGNLGNAYIEKKQYDDAKSCYDRALIISRELKNRYRESQALHNLGYLSENRGNLEEAIAKYEESISIKREISLYSGAGNSFDNLGLLYAKKGMWPKAIETCEEGLRAERELGDRYGEGKTLVNLGIIYFGQRIWPEALKKYNAALGIFQDIKYSYGEGMCLANIGAVYRECSQMDEAIIAWRDALEKLPVSSKEYKKVNGWLASNNRNPAT